MINQKSIIAIITLVLIGLLVLFGSTHENWSTSPGTISQLLTSRADPYNPVHNYAWGKPYYGPRFQESYYIPYNFYYIY